MRKISCVILGGLIWLGSFGAAAQAGGKGSWSVGVSFGSPGYYRPGYPGCGHYPYPYSYYRPYPIYIAPPPVVYAPAPIVVQQAPVVQQVQPVYTPPSAKPAEEQAPPPRPLPALTPVSDTQRVDTERCLQQLASPDESVRIDSVMQLGRMKSLRAIDPLAATLSGDRSPAVREAAARALGLIGSAKAIPALQQAGQIDSDQNVRRSAQFSVDVIQTR